MSYWQKQINEPLYPDLLWSKPVTKRGAGKLLIIGGNANGFSLVAQAFTEAEKAGAGHIRAVVPDSLAKLTKGLPFIEYASSNPSGGFARSALGTLLELAEWSDGVLLAGDLGKNSETSLLLDDFLQKCPNVTTIAPEALPSLSLSAIELLGSRRRVVIWARQDLQRAVIDLKLSKAVKSDSSMQQVAEVLHEISEEHIASIVILDGDTIWTAQRGIITSTHTSKSTATGPFAVWAIQNPEKLGEALVCAAWEISQK